jgi:hypothetical protein
LRPNLVGVSQLDIDIISMADWLAGYSTNQKLSMLACGQVVTKSEGIGSGN